MSASCEKLQRFKRKKDVTVIGFNADRNDSESSVQTIFHCRIHLIPRRDGDAASPRGGVRGVIPERHDQ